MRCRRNLNPVLNLNRQPERIKIKMTIKIAAKLSGGGFAPHFDLDVVVHFVGRVALAVKTDVTALHAFGVNQLALVSFDVGESLPAPRPSSLSASLLKIVVTSLLNFGSSETCTTTSK